MTAAPHPRLAETFARVVASQPPERAAVLERECAGDPALRQQCERLLDHDAAPWTSGQGHPIDGPPIVSAAAVEAALSRSPGDEIVAGYGPGAIIDQYTIEREIGRGGFGVVYLAKDMLLGGRLVALKVLERMNLARRFIARFRQERLTLERLDHPGIARVHKEGMTAAGHPYFAMEFIAHGTGPAPRITDYADLHQLSIRERVKLFLPVCLAVQHAHQQAVIHRDLKPSNILVEERDGQVQPKIIDFGVARHLEEHQGNDPRDPATMLTLPGEVVGTVGYMSPEQATGTHVNTPSDVYSLGIVLYELLCGTLPLPSLRPGVPLGEQLLAICNEEPVLPSKAVLQAGAHVANARGVDARRLGRQLRGDLDTILNRLLEKDPARRFSSASGIAEDLQRYLSNQPVESRPHSLLYTLGKLARRHRGFVAAATMVSACLVATVVVSLLAMRIAWREQERAQVMTAIANLRSAQYGISNDDGAAVGRSLDDVPVGLRDWEWYHLLSQSDRSVGRIGSFAGSTSALAGRPDGMRLLVGDREGHTTTVDTGSLRRVDPVVTNPKRRIGGCDVWSVAWSPAGDVFATGSFDNVVRLHRADGSPPRVVPYPGTGAIYAVAFSPDGQRLAVGGGDLDLKSNQPQFVDLLDVATKRRVWRDDTTHKQPVNDVAFSADGRWLASGSDDQTICVWSIGEGEPGPPRPIATGAKVHAVAFSPDSSLLAAGTNAGEIQLFHVPSLVPVCPSLQGHRNAVASVMFHPDGRSLASASWDSTVRLWSLPDGRPLDVLHGHRGRVNRVAFAPHGRLFSASDDRTVLEWNPARRPDTSLSTGRGSIRSLGVLAGGDIVVHFADKSLSLVSAVGRSTSELGHVHCGHVEITPDRSTIAWIGSDCVQTWRVDRGAIKHTFPADARAPTTGICALGNRYLLLHCGSRMLQLDHVADRWRMLEPLPATTIGHEMHAAWLGDDGQVLATCWNNNAGSVFCMRNGRTNRIPPPWNPAWISSGRHTVLVGADSRDLALYDNESGSLLPSMIGHLERVLGAAFSPNGTRLASVGKDHVLRIWDWQRGLQVLSIPHPKASSPNRSDYTTFCSVAWSPDGRTIVTGSDDGTIHFWPSRRQ